MFSRTFCSQNVKEGTLQNIYRVGLYLEHLILIDCGIRKLPENLFLFLPRLKVVDLRKNLLVSLPESLAYHPNIEVLLLSGNLFIYTPSILQTLPSLVKHDLGMTIRNTNSHQRKYQFDYTVSCQSRNSERPLIYVGHVVYKSLIRRGWGDCKIPNIPFLGLTDTCCETRKTST